MLTVTPIPDPPLLGRSQRCRRELASFGAHLQSGHALEAGGPTHALRVRGECALERQPRSYFDQRAAAGDRGQEACLRRPLGLKGFPQKPLERGFLRGVQGPGTR